MIRISRIAAVLLLLALSALAGDWTEVAPGVAYREFSRAGFAAHVARVEIAKTSMEVIASDSSDRGLTVSEFAKKRGAVVAINGDYFTEALNPIGLAMGPCGTWPGTRDTKREGIVAFGERHVAIYRQAVVNDPPPTWAEGVVSGWPLIVRRCRAYAPMQLPGSDHFTRAPHPRTAIGLSKKGDVLFLVVVDGRRDGVPGVTLAELATFMDEELGVCSALNLDGGGSSTMVVDGRIVNQPSDGKEREVANHVGVVLNAECRMQN
ncbi:MAG: phosphodiester glycosidase family protein [Thermoanaerobaculia bacterium]